MIRINSIDESLQHIEAVIDADVDPSPGLDQLIDLSVGLNCKLHTLLKKVKRRSELNCDAVAIIENTLRELALLVDYNNIPKDATIYQYIDIIASMMEAIHPLLLAVKELRD